MCKHLNAYINQMKLEKKRCYAYNNIMHLKGGKQRIKPKNQWQSNETERKEKEEEKNGKYLSNILAFLLSIMSSV